MRIIRGTCGELASIELTADEMRELLAFEASCVCLFEGNTRAFLEDVCKHYGVPAEDMRPYFEQSCLARDDVWRLQILKRSAQAQYRAVHIIGDLRKLEFELGIGVLETYVDRNRILPSA